jgi:ABC-type multidrug transport system permease subunit
MNRLRPLWQLFLARVREFYREPEVIFWVYGFPILLAVGLGIAFANREPEPTPVDVQDSASATEAAALVDYLRDHHVRAELQPEEAARQRLRVGKVVLVVVPRPDGYDYVYDATRQDSLAARYQVDALVQRWKSRPAAGSPPPQPTADVLLTEPGSRYIDFLLPGLMGMNLMGSGMWGVGFVVVDMRVRKLLKRLLATPMRRGDFLLALITSRLTMLVPEMLLIGVIGAAAYGVPYRGSLVALAVVMLAGAAAFSGIGLLAASRSEKPETVASLINVIMLPQFILSGTFFSAKRFPDFMQPLIQALPLTQINAALREVMLEGAGFADVWWRVATLAAFAVVGFLTALRVFRWV